MKARTSAGSRDAPPSGPAAGGRGAGDAAVSAGWLRCVVAGTSLSDPPGLGGVDGPCCPSMGTKAPNVAPLVASLYLVVSEFGVGSTTVNAIEVGGLRKAFGKAVALDGLGLTVAAGEVHGFLGPNGAGKTTTIRILLGLLRADAGAARLLGGDPWHSAVELHKRLAYVPGDVTLWPTLTGGEVIDLLGKLRGDLDTKRRDELLERFDLD